MPHLFGKEFTRRELESRIGSLRQVGGIRTLRFEHGPEDGVRVFQVESGSGLVYHVLPDRGLDISSAKWNGASLSWDSPCGEAHPAHFDPRGLGWLKTFYGGLVVTCGMTWCGYGAEDSAQGQGLHGRYSHLQARNVQVAEEWDGDRCVLRIEGDLRETVVFGENVLCHRKIATELGTNTIHIEDTVINQGFERAPHMFLYHINLGYPVVSENSHFLSSAASVTPRDAVAADGRSEYAHFDPPIAGYKEKVYFHDMNVGPDGYVTAAIVNREFHPGHGLGVEVRYRKAELPRFIQWKNVGATTYVCGLEPANCLVMGRLDEERRGTLEYLEPGQSKHYDLTIRALTSPDDIRATQDRIKDAELRG